MIEYIKVFLNFLLYGSNNLLFKIFFTIGYLGVILKVIDNNMIGFNLADVFTSIGISGIIMSFVWVKKRNNIK